MKKAILTCGLFSLMMVLTSFTNPSGLGQKNTNSTYSNEIGGQRLPGGDPLAIGGQRLPGGDPLAIGGQRLPGGDPLY